MDETKQNEPMYSSERAETTAMEGPPVPTATVESSGTDKMGQGAVESPKNRAAELLELVSFTGLASPAEFVAFVKRTRRVWLATAGVIVGVVALVTAMKDLTQWVKNKRERRQEQAVASVTPERLIARCGPPEEDSTTEVFPIVMRTMSYQARGQAKLVVAFSRTAEEKSDWVFLSMKDEGEPRNYDSPQTKIAALPCMDSKK